MLSCVLISDVFLLEGEYWADEGIYEFQRN